MNRFFLKRPEDLIKAGTISIGLAILLSRFGSKIINPDYASTLVYIIANAFIFVFFWILVYFLIQRFSLYKILGAMGLFVLAAAAEAQMDIWNSLVTFPLVILFWLGVVYLVLPEFFKKYRVPILSIYGSVIAYYFFIFEMTPDDTGNHRLNFINFLLVPIPVFAFLWIYEQWRWLKTLQADKAKAELALLKNQINPHFFFNTLNNLYGLVVEKSTQAPEVVLKLSDMMRYVIYDGKEDLVNLIDEVKYLENYIELHKIRYQKKVDIRFVHKVDKEIQLAPLLFIFLLENAFKHGVEPLTENAYIHLGLIAKDDQVSFTVENNYELNNSSQKPGIGLDNLKKRLAHIYPDRHELRIEKTDSTYTVQLNLLLT